MKIIQEYSIKIIIFVFVLSILIEAGILVLTVIRSSSIFNDVYDNTIQNSEIKSFGIIEKIKNYINSLLSKYNTDLKLICKHSLLLIGKTANNPSLLINKNSKIFQNNDEIKKIVPANLETLLNLDYINAFYNESSKTFEYLNYYEEEFKNISERNQILNSLFSNSSHPELNAISFYSPNKIESEHKLTAKYMISILKTIYITRYISKRANMDFIHFIILYSDEIYIYPPKPIEATNIFSMNLIYPSVCNYSSSFPIQHFPSCISLIVEKATAYGNYFSLIYRRLLFENVFMTNCLKFKFVEGDQKYASICMEINFSKLLNSISFSKTDKFDFGIFFRDDKDFYPITFNKNHLYNDMKKIFNDTVTKRYILDEKTNPTFSLFHFLYYNLTKVAKEHPELKVNFTQIEEEYNDIKRQLTNTLNEHAVINQNNKNDIIKVPFIQTICQKGLLVNTYECIKDTFEFILFPIFLNVSPLNEDFLERTFSMEININITSYAIISINPDYNHKLITTILRIKIERTIILFFFLTIIIMCFYILILNFLSEFSLNPINKIIGELKQINITNDSKKFNTLKEDKIMAINKEMFHLKHIYEIMRKSLIIKQVFEKEYFLEKHNLEFYNLVQDIDKKNIKEICNSYLGFYHYKNESFNLAENELNSTISYIIENLNIATAGKDSEYEDKIKDSIKRSSTFSYINEYSKFEKIEENLLTIINLNIFKQRFMYLYAMTKFKLGNEINNANSGQTAGGNKNKTKKDKDKRINYFKEAIKNFTECKNINVMLGINQIKIIYSLIMISKCYIQLNDYPNSINNINEALSLFFEFSKSFKDYHSKNYNPKIMLFIENNIFHYILFTIERICYSFNKPFASSWIILQIFETSPFLISNIHYHSAIFLQTFLDKNRQKLNKVDATFLANNSHLKEYKKTKKYIYKIFSRMNVKNTNSKMIKKKNEKSLGDSSYSASYQNISDTRTERSIFSSTFKKEMQTSKLNSFHYKNKTLNKIITLCLSEKILEKVNGIELKDVIIKYFQKYFVMNENDKFSFIQFANNGKKTVYFKMEQLDYFLLKIQKTKNTFELTDSFIPNKSSPFMELYNIFDSIIKNYPSSEEPTSDYIIIMFINSDDIRFTSVNECLSIVGELNKKNVSVYLLSYDEEIKKDKINNIDSFLEGLFEGYFFQIKNYQQLKQIFINLSVVKYQSNFFGYDFNSLDNVI